MDDSAPADTHCRNCHAPLAPTDAYCPRCGQKVAVHRLTLHEISHDLMHALLHVDRSVLSLLRLLLTQPGRVARDFVEGKRKRYFGPFALLVIVVTLAAAAVHLSGTQKLVLVPEGPAAMAAFIQEFLIKHANLMYFIQVPLLAAACRALGVNGRFNYAEYLVLAAYTSSMRILFFTLAVIPLKFAVAGASTAVIQLYVVYLSLWALYFGVAMAQFLGERRVLSAIKGIVSVILAQVLASLILSTLAQILIQLHFSSAPAGANP